MLMDHRSKILIRTVDRSSLSRLVASPDQL